jgi:hypothetical protein
MHVVAGGVGADADFGAGVTTGEPGTFVATYLPDGALDWVERRGGTGTDRANGVFIDDLGRVYVAGEFRPSLDLGHGPLPSQGGIDGFAGRFSATGPDWSAAGGSGGGDWFHAPAAADGGMIAVGNLSSDAVYGPLAVPVVGERDGVVVRYDATGSPLWATSLGATGSDDARAVAVLPDGSSYVSGEAEGAARGHVALGTDGFVARLDPSGTVEWTLWLEGAGFGRFYGVAADAAGNAYVTGDYDGDAVLDTFDLSAGVGRQIVVARIGADRRVHWVSTAGGDGDEYGHGIVARGDGVYVTGNLSIAFAWGGHVLPETGGRRHGFVARLSADGAEVLWVHTFDGLTTLGVGASDDGLVGVAGYFSGTALTGTPFELTSFGEGDVAMVRLRQTSR